MNDEDPNMKYDYRIDVREEDAKVSYFSDSIDLSKPTFVTFASRYRLSRRTKGEELRGQILTFPSHLVRKITNFVRT
jgi:hypothetical protein